MGRLNPRDSVNYPGARPPLMRSDDMPKPTCLNDGCETPSHRAGRCTTHYRHALEAGETGAAAPCKWLDCKSFASTRGFCHNHYARAARANDFDKPWVASSPAVCRWPECDRTAEKIGLCRRDYQRSRKLGHPEAPWETWTNGRDGKPKVACRWLGCDLEEKYAGYCARDYSRAKALGNSVDPWLYWDTSGTCVVCGTEWEPGRNRNRRVCSKVCAAKEWGQLNPDRAKASKKASTQRRRARQMDATVEHFTASDVRAYHGDDCYLCDKKINYSLKFPHPKSPSLDHVQPLSRGGAHSLENCAMAHLECNLKKHAAPAVKLPQPTLLAI
jgi:hypothetical protein